jgi:hypothetical protein
LRRDRDNYIQDLLAEAEATQRRHEGEISRRTVRSQREVAERLSAQQREHDVHLEERSRAHAAALAQQAWQHEREIEELRKSLRIDAERRIAERLTESANHHRDVLLRLQRGIDDLRQRLASHSATLDDSVLGDSDRIMKGKDSNAKPDGTQGLATATSSSASAEPEPEEAVPEHTLLAPRDAAEAEALAERAANEAAEAVEWAITLARKDIECVLKAGQLVAEHAVSDHESKLKEATQFDQKLKEATTRLESEKRKLCRVTKDYAASAATASSQTLLLKVFFVWSDEVRRLRALVAEQQRVFNKRQQRQPLILSRIQADVDQYVHIIFRTWVMVFSHAKRETQEQQTLQQRNQQIVDDKARLRMSMVTASDNDDRWHQQVLFQAWVAEYRCSRCQASHQNALAKAAGVAAAQHSAMRSEAERDALTLRLKRRSQGIENIHADLEQTQRSILRAWLSATKSSCAVRAIEEKLKCQSKQLGESKQTRGLLVAQVAAEHTLLMTLRAWAAAHMVAKCEAEGVQRLDAAVAEVTKAKAEVEQEAQSLSARFSGECRTQGLRLGRAHTGFQKRIMLFRWAFTTREARKEANHRRQMITAAADASAEVYKLRGESKKVAVELRKQRRAHGVAAIHANLDRRLQSVLLAWGTVVRDGQREAAYQRQLDIAAAESAAGCAVLRMEGRRATLELREERYRQALRAIDAGLRHWQHLALREWWAQAEAARRQAKFEEQLAEELRQASKSTADAEARHRTELREQAEDCEARISSSLSAAASGVEASLHKAADLRAQEACAEAHAKEVAQLCEERETLQAQIAKLHDELRHNHSQP